MYFIFTDKNDMYYDMYENYDTYQIISINNIGLKTNNDKEWIKIQKLSLLNNKLQDTYYIRSVCIIPDSEYYSTISDCLDSMFVINMNIIIGDRYCVYDPLTIKKFNLKVDNNFIEGACKFNNIKFLEWWLKSNLSIKYDLQSCLDLASAHGQVDVLEWWQNSGLLSGHNIELRLEKPNLKGHVNVLEWAKNCGLPLSYGEWCLYDARRNKSVLEWWLNSGLELKYHDFIISYMPNEAIAWFIKNNYKIPLSNIIFYRIDQMITLCYNFLRSSSKIIKNVYDFFRI
jgi:hypothetical protein